MLEGKNILLGICGSIACYKSAYLIRLLKQAGANVQVIMTFSATQFITPITIAALSKNPVLIKHVDLLANQWNDHIALGLWADYMIIAPASANTIAKMANGFCDNLLTATYLSVRSRVYFAPAMDLDMWHHIATQQNVQELKKRYGHALIPPETGELASGLCGEGRMAEPKAIVSFLEEDIRKHLPLKNKKALVTAGPTFEAIDPIRFIGNFSSGKMGFAIAEVLYELGAEVILITGPTALSIKYEQINRIDVVSCEEMCYEAEKHFSRSDILVMNAAVADYRPEMVACHKIKKEADHWCLSLIKTPDILGRLSHQKKNGQLVIGFALESENEEANAIKKLQEKNLDFIVLNSLKDVRSIFKDENKVTIITPDLHATSYELKPKREVAKDICNKILALML